MTAAAQCFLVWFGAQYVFNISLSLTSVTSNTILSSSSSLFTFALSMLVLKEPYSAAKLLSIIACMAGTLLVTLADRQAESGDGSGASSAGLPSLGVLGDLMCLLSAVLYACYTVVLRRSLPDDEEANVMLFFGYVGLYNTLLLAPVVALGAWRGSMPLGSLPGQAYALILAEGTLDYLFSDYLWARSVLLLGPTLATLGLSMQIPVAAVVELLMGTAAWTHNGAAGMLTTALGAALIMAGFVGGNMAGAGQAVPGEHHRRAGDGGPGAAGGGGQGSHGGRQLLSAQDDDEAGGNSGSAWGVAGDGSVPVSTSAGAGQQRYPGQAGVEGGSCEGGRLSKSPGDQQRQAAGSQKWKDGNRGAAP